MSWSSFTPHPELRPYVEELLVQDEGDGSPGAGEVYKVWPKPFSVVGFQYRGRLRVLRENQRDLLSRGGITGLHESYRCFQSDPDTRTILVVLKPHGAFPLLRGVPMHELTESHVGLDALVPPSVFHPVVERLAEGGPPEALARVAQRLFLARLAQSKAVVHPAVARAASRIVRERGAVRIEDLARESGLSRRQIERLFLTQVGVSPKGLASLARFDGVLRRLDGRASWADLAHAAGYADQAHLVRDFVQRTGVTPTRYVPVPTPG